MSRQDDDDVLPGVVGKPQGLEANRVAMLRAIERLVRDPDDQDSNRLLVQLIMSDDYEWWNDMQIRNALADLLGKYVRRSH